MKTYLFQDEDLTDIARSCLDLSRYRLQEEDCTVRRDISTTIRPIPLDRDSHQLMVRMIAVYLDLGQRHHNFTSALSALTEQSVELVTRFRINQTRHFDRIVRVLKRARLSYLLMFSRDPIPT